MRIVSRLFTRTSIALACLVAQAQAADFGKLVDYVPETANALVLVDAESLFYSPIATKENWQDLREEHFATGETGIPPNAKKLVIAADIHADSMHPAWEVAVVEMKAVATLERLAKKFGGQMETVNSVPAVQLPDDNFMLQFPDGLFAMMAPGNRQNVARWIDRNNRGLSPYLQRAVKYVEGSAQIIMSLDLDHAFHADSIQRGLEELSSVSKSQIDTTELAKLVASVEGVTLGVSFKEQATGKLIFDFGQEPTLISGMAKPLVLDILGSYGLTISEMADWNAQLHGKQLVLAGQLDEEGLSHLTSLIQLPTSVLHHHAHGSDLDSDGEGQTVSSGESTVLEATKKYHTSVDRILKRLRVKKHDAQTMGQIAQWLQNYARYIDRLPTLNVDDEMLQFGNYISSQLRGGSMSVKGVNIQKRVNTVAAADSAQIYGGALREVSGWGADSANPNAGTGYGAGAYGAYGRVRSTNAIFGIARRRGPQGAIRSELRQQQLARTKVTVQARAQQASSLQQLIDNIETATAQIRQSMTQKYQVQF